MAPACLGKTFAEVVEVDDGLDILVSVDVESWAEWGMLTELVWGKNSWVEDKEVKLGGVTCRRAVSLYSWPRRGVLSETQRAAGGGCMDGHRG